MNEILDLEEEVFPAPVYAKKSIKAFIIVVIFYAVIITVHYYMLNAMSKIGSSSIDVKGWVIWVVLLFGIGNLCRGLYYGIKSISNKENSIGMKYIGTFGSLMLIIITLAFFSHLLFP